MKSLIEDNRIFSWIVMVIAVILLIPLTAMQFSKEVNWDVGDFVVMAAMLTLASTIAVYTARSIPRKYHRLLMIMISLVVLYCWAEMAVGIFFSIGS
ncbi:hypothetical protein [Shewanella sp. Isolate11]|uniref:hypothetical protein n=1 Tax=Shewanella sp. Isolate11 TaxID=2908530 RepID=UPI001EFDDADD|nr:hypothetical protein [Shewanella sp. Isolate11]MCG9696893.1 hypothetical protein [Shewanella sp. Isolate11]